METKVEIKDNLKTKSNENAYIIAITKAEGKTIHVKITEEELSDLIGDALDGGDYWIGRIRAVDKEEDLCTAEEESICKRKDKPAEIMETDHVLDTGNIDANIADSMLQFGLFGELVYG